MSRVVVNVAKNPIAALYTPRQLGPRMRIPLARAISPMRRCRAAPAASVSAKPDVNTTAAPTPFAAHASMVSRTFEAVTATTATSIGPGTSLTCGRASSPCTRSRRGLTGHTAPRNPDSFR